MHGRRMARSQEAMASMFLGCVGTFTPSRGLSVGCGRDWMKHDGCGGGPAPWCNGECGVWVRVERIGVP